MHLLAVPVAGADRYALHDSMPRIRKGLAVRTGTGPYGIGGSAVKDRAWASGRPGLHGPGSNDPSRADRLRSASSAPLRSQVARASRPITSAYTPPRLSRQRQRFPPDPARSGRMEEVTMPEGKVLTLRLSMMGRPVRSYTFGKPTVTVGRDPDADVFIDNPGVSREHLRFEAHRGQRVRSRRRRERERHVPQRPAGQVQDHPAQRRQRALREVFARRAL